MKIAYLDDEHHNIVLFEDIIKEIPDINYLGGFTSTIEFTKAFEKEPADVVFCDIEMPGTNGIMLAKRLQAMSEGVSVVFITGHPEYAMRAYDVEAIGFLVKPVDKRSVEKQINKLRYLYN